MGTTFQRGATTYTPTLVLGFRSTREAGNLIHRIPGSATVEVSERPASLRSGELSVLFAGATAEADSAAFETALSTGEEIDLVSDEASSAAMTLVNVESLDRELEDSTREAWIVTFGFQEVP